MSPEEEKSLSLLNSWLTLEQQKELTEHGYFYVKGGTTGHKYKITTGRSLNISRCDLDGTFVTSMCFGPEPKWHEGEYLSSYECLPVHDFMLAQKLALELNELEVLKVANFGHPVPVSCTVAPTLLRVVFGTVVVEMLILIGMTIYHAVK